jgi:hypothetical protein
MAAAARTPLSRPVSSTSSRPSSRAAANKEPSIGAPDQPIEISDDEDVQVLGLELAEVWIDKPEDFDKDEYLVLEGENAVYKVLREESVESGIAYRVRFGDNRTEVVSLTCQYPYPSIQCHSYSRL